MKRFSLSIIICLIVSSFAYSQEKVRLISSQRILLDASYDEAINKDLKKYLAPYQNKLDREMNTIVANAAEPITADDPAGALNYWVADAMLRQMSKLSRQHIDMALVNNHAIRKDLPEGPITLRDMYECFPFDNEIVILQLKASDMRSLLRTVARNARDSFAGVSIEVKDGKLHDMRIGGKLWNKDQVYTIVTIDYLAEGSGGMAVLKKALNKKACNVYLRDLMIKEFEAYYQRGKLLRYTVDNRFNVLP